jgi:predicted Zn-dependent peptidase
MLMVSRTYKPGHTAEEILKEVDPSSPICSSTDRRREVPTPVRFRSNFYDALETTGGKANLLASFALSRRPAQINKVLPAYDTVTAAQIQSVAQKYFVTTNRTSIDRVPAKETK